MFSRRTAASLAPNALARLLEAKRAAGARILDLTASNPTRCGLPYPGEAILAALANPEALVYAPEPRGAWPAREAVARYYAARGAAVDPARIVLTASTSEAYSFLFTVLCDAGDSILVPAPSYPLLDHLAALSPVRTVPYPIRFDGDAWRIDLDALAAAARDEARARAVVAVSPNNPTGSFLTRREAAAIASLCAARGLALIVDEVFADFAYGPDPERAATVAGGLGDLPAGDAPLAFALNGLSKVAGLPQLKLGWLVASGSEAHVAAALERLDLVADTFLSVSTPVQVALPALLDLAPRIREAILERVSTNRARLAGRIGPGSPCRLLPAEGGWYAILQVPRGEGEEALVLSLLDRDDVLVHPGYFFDFPSEAYLVVSLLPEPDVFEEATRRLLARVST
ncbi:MAG TPA: pyridoxal phosphate-dependent aminotransferase [Thermodesulfobacteriota bacterium]